ncbi:hypothetical protein AAVH_14849, partial [Aphelenchoides avenae]
RNACDADCPTSQIDELCKAYFVTWVNDRDLIPSLTEKRDNMEFRKLVGLAAALRANLDQYRQMSHNPSGQSAVAAQPAQNAARAGPPQQQPRRDAAPQQRRDAPASFNPNRMSLRYQGQFPPAKNNFATPRVPPSTAAVEPINLNEATFKPDESCAGGPDLTDVWQQMDDSYFDPFEVPAKESRRGRRRRQRLQEHDYGATANTLTVPDLPKKQK